MYIILLWNNSRNGISLIPEFVAFHLEFTFIRHTCIITMNLKNTIITLIANVGVSTVLAFITMCLLLKFMPLRHLFDFASDSMNWGPAQALPFAFTDLLYITSGKIASIILGLSAGVMMVFIRLNSTKWWIAFVLSLCYYMKLVGGGRLIGCIF